MSSSESSSVDSPSPPASPAASYHGPPNLERLVLHFVAAKRSLTSTSHIYRANELVTASRDLIEEIAILTARNAFAQRRLHDQVDLGESIRDAIAIDADGVSSVFDATLQSLDHAHQRLERTLDSLKQTLVKTTLRKHAAEYSPEGSTSNPRESSSMEPERQTLYDFIDENNHEQLLESLRALIDSFHATRAGLDGHQGAFGDALRDISESILGAPEITAPPGKPMLYDEPPATLRQLLHEMEDHATEMASLLGNLVNHYDLCVTALKHTEGGGAAAKEAIQAEHLTVKGTPGTEESLYKATVPAPMDQEERREMLHVLEKDAFEVDDVIEEIRARELEMGDFHEQVSRHASKARQKNKTLCHVLDLLYHLRASVPSHVEAALTFRNTWQAIQLSMEAKTQEVVELAAFYEQFLAGYGKLLREVERRRACEGEMRRVAEKARREIDRLYEDDRLLREEFMDDVGEYLPRDIWHGLADEAPRWEIRAVSQEGESHEQTAEGGSAG